MATVTSLRRWVVKGMLWNVVAIRNMFVGELSLDTIDEEADGVEAYLDAIYTPILPDMTTQMTLQTVEIQDRILGHWLTSDEIGYSKAGGVTGDTLANFVAGVIIGKIQGHKGHGRKFFSGWCEQAVLGNSVVAGTLAHLVTSLAAYITPVTFGLGSTYTPGLILKDGNFYPFTSGFVSSLLGTMRRRKPGLGI